MKVMVLAAGLGTRFQPHTDLIPKPAMPFLNAPLAAIALQSILPIEPKGLVVNTFHLPALIKNLFNVVLRPLGLPVEFSDETDFIRGSGGGLKFADTLFKEEAHFLLINSDEVFFPENSEFIQEAYAQHLSSGALSTLVTTTHPEVGSKFGGIWTDANHRVLGFGKKQHPGSSHGHHFIGIQILSSRIFQYLPADRESNILYDGLTKAFLSGECAYVFPVTGVWHEIGSLPDYLRATHQTLQLLAGGSGPCVRYLKTLLARWAPGSDLRNGESKALIWADTSACFSPDQISEFAVLGPQSVVTPGISVTGSVIAANVTVDSDLHHQLKLAR
jgi:mannose-1-phosphate guanylyltransferase